MLRIMIAAIALAAAGPAAAEQLNVEAARQFVVGKLFAFNCFEGTHGAGRIYTDGSVAGTVQFGGSGPVRYVTLPAGTVRAQGESVCATVSGLPMQPCFNLDKTDPQSFRGSVSGLRRDDGPQVAGFVLRSPSSSVACNEVVKPQIDALHNQI
ncbi:MAG: hypothetical protein ACXWC4_20575 [Telluria sp.]